jgi:hypothetical protein
METNANPNFANPNSATPVRESYLFSAAKAIVNPINHGCSDQPLLWGVGGCIGTQIINKTSPKREGVGEPHLKIWDRNLGQFDKQTDRRTNGQTIPEKELLCNQKMWARLTFNFWIYFYCPKMDFGYSFIALKWTLD